MTETSMNANQATTLIENELFENFVQSDIKLTADNVRIADFFTGFDTTGLDEVCERLVEECCDERMTTNPSEVLGWVADEFRGVAFNLEVVQKAFERFKEKYLVGGEGAEARYSAPSFNEETASIIQSPGSPNIPSDSK